MKPTLAVCLAPGVAAITRQQLQQLSTAELIEIIWQLQQRLTELAEQLRGLTGPPKDSTNSSIPPSKSPQMLLNWTPLPAGASRLDV